MLPVLRGSLLVLCLHLAYCADTDYLLSECSKADLAPNYDRGDGSEDRPFLLCSFEELDKMREGLDKHYVLGTNLDLSGKDWAPVGDNSTGDDSSRFSGSLNGKGYVIFNLTVNTEDYGGFLGYTNSNADIRNVSLKDLRIVSDQYVGGLAGWNGGTISNSYATGVVIGTGNTVGGLVGQNDGGMISNSYGMISNSYAAGTVIGTGNTIGGLVGQSSNGSISNSYATGTVSGIGTSSNDVGGLVGNFANGSISDSYATGAVTGTEDNVGGLVGNFASGTGNISSSYATGAVDGGNNVGGLVGNFASGSISSSYATGAVTGTEDNVGGLVGNFASGTGNISSSYATGAVDGGNNVGGLVGNFASGSISNSYAAGAVDSTGNNIGGLAGQSAGSISNSYAAGTVSGTDQVGGLVGWNNGGSISNSYAAGAVPGSGSNVGGLVGNLQSGSISGINYFADDVGGVNGLGTGSCDATVCMQAMGGDDAARAVWLRDSLDEAVELGWDSAIWNGLGASGFPTLR